MVRKRAREIFISNWFRLSLDVNLIGKDGETPLHTAARYDFDLDQVFSYRSRY